MSCSASIVLQVEFLSADPVINVFKTYLGTKIQKQRSISGRLVALGPGRYSYELNLSVQGLNGPMQERIKDHILVGHHLWRRAKGCPASGQWPWRITIGFPDGQRQLTGTVRCGT